MFVYVANIFLEPLVQSESVLTAQEECSGKRCNICLYIFIITGKNNALTPMLGLWTLLKITSTR